MIKKIIKNLLLNKKNSNYERTVDQGKDITWRRFVGVVELPIVDKQNFEFHDLGFSE